MLINQWATSYLSNNDPRLHVGLGLQNQIDQLDINWSDGKKEVYRNIIADCYLTILQGKGLVAK